MSEEVGAAVVETRSEVEESRRQSRERCRPEAG
jgi:hypothetical protein